MTLIFFNNIPKQKFESIIFEGLVKHYSYICKYIINVIQEEFMPNKDKIIEIIYSAIDEINEDLPKKNRLLKMTDENIFGNNGKLDSLGLVNLIVAIEGAIDTELDKSIIIANEKAMSMKNSPFRTVGTLSDFIEELIENE